MWDDNYIYVYILNIFGYKPGTVYDDVTSTPHMNVPLPGTNGASGCQKANQERSHNMN